MRPARLAALFLLPLSACGGVPGTASGTVQQQPFAIKDAIAVRNEQNQLIVMLSSTSGLCTYFENKKNPKGASLLSFVLAERDTNGNALPITPGPFVFQSGEGGTPPTKLAIASMIRSPEGSCVNQGGSAVQVQTGSVELSSLDGGAKGSFSLTFTTGEQLTGSFDAMSCSFPVQGLQQFACF